MSPLFRLCRHAASCGAAPLAALVLSASLCGAQTSPSQPATTAQDPQEARPDPAAPPPDKAPQFFNDVTVTATMSPAVVKDVPGTVSVIDAEAIARGLIENTADLVKFEPGVYIESNLTRIGLNGFNIRGIGGNRVMTQIDGIETTEQFDFGPFNVHQFGLDLDTLKSAEIVRSAGSSMYGSDALGGVVSFFTKADGRRPTIDAPRPASVMESGGPFVGSCGGGARARGEPRWLDPRRARTDSCRRTRARLAGRHDAAGSVEFRRGTR